MEEIFSKIMLFGFMGLALFIIIQAYSRKIELFKTYTASKWDNISQKFEDCHRLAGSMINEMKGEHVVDARPSNKVLDGPVWRYQFRYLWGEFCETYPKDPWLNADRNGAMHAFLKQRCEKMLVQRLTEMRNEWLASVEPRFLQTRHIELLMAISEGGKNSFDPHEAGLLEDCHYNKCLLINPANKEMVWPIEVSVIGFEVCNHHAISEDATGWCVLFDREGGQHYIYEEKERNLIYQHYYLKAEKEGFWSAKRPYTQ